MLPPVIRGVLGHQGQQEQRSPELQVYDKDVVSAMALCAVAYTNQQKYLAYQHKLHSQWLVALGAHLGRVSCLITHISAKLCHMFQTCLMCQVVEHSSFGSYLSQVTCWKGLWCQSSSS